MSASHDYAMLVTSLPYHGPLFGARQAPLSRIRLRQRQRLLDDRDRACLRVVADLLEWSRQGMERSDTEIIARARVEVPGLDNAFARDLVVWRLELRTVVAALRRRHRGLAAPAGDDNWGFGRWQKHIRRYWNEPLFRLERVYPWLAEARTLLENGDALGLERLLLTAVWEHLERVADGHHFDFEAVLIYSMRWDLVARWTGYSAEAARVRFEAMVREGLETVMPEPGVLAGTLPDAASTGD
jgi:hypothetical protein